MQDHDPGDHPAGKQQANRSCQTAASKKIRGKKQNTTVIYILVFLLWAGLVGGGYFALRWHLQKSEQHFTRQLDALKVENQHIAADIVAAMSLFEQELVASQEEMEQIRREMDLIQEELELTGESITGTDATRQSLAERITELDQQLAGLKEQIRKLEAAVRAL